MSVKFITGNPVERPKVDPIKSSILDHADVREPDHFQLRNNTGLWISYEDIEVQHDVLALCDDQDEIDRDSGVLVPGYEFSLTAGVESSIVSLDKDDFLTEAKRIFAAWEGRETEDALRTGRFVADTGLNPLWGAPVDVTPSVDITLANALALLESYAAQHYSGVATIHMPRAVASMLNERIVWNGDKAYTRLGSKVALGGGYDADIASGEWTIYATGEVVVEREAQIELSAISVPGDQSPAGDNMISAYIERRYRVGVDGFVAKATGKVW